MKHQLEEIEKVRNGLQREAFQYCKDNLVASSASKLARSPRSPKSRNRTTEEFLRSVERHQDLSQTLRQDLVEEKEQQFFDDCPFHPSLSNASRHICARIQRKPIDQRIYQEMSARKEKLDRLKQQAQDQKDQEEKLEQKFFSPSKSSKSLQPNKSYKRGVQWKKVRDRKIVEEQARILERSLSAYKNKPELISNSKAFSGVENSTFEERQRAYSQKMALKKLEKQRELLEHNPVPNLNKKSLHLAELSQQRKKMTHLVGCLEDSSSANHTERLEVDRLIFMTPSEAKKHRKALLREKERRKEKENHPLESGPEEGYSIEGIALRNKKLLDRKKAKNLITALPQRDRNPTLESEALEKSPFRKRPLRQVKDLSELRRFDNQEEIQIDL